MATFHRILIRLGIVWLSLVGIIVVIAHIFNSKNLTPDAYMMWGMLACPALLIFALAWAIKPAA